MANAATAKPARRIILSPRRAKEKAKAKEREKAKRARKIKPTAVIQPEKVIGRTKTKIVDLRALRAEIKTKRARKEEKVRHARKAKAKGKAIRVDLSRQERGQPSATNGTKTNAHTARANSTILRTARSGSRGGVTTARSAASVTNPICERRGERT